MRLLLQPRTIEPARFPFNQLDLFLRDFKWLCELTASLRQEEKHEHVFFFFFLRECVRWVD